MQAAMYDKLIPGLTMGFPGLRRHFSFPRCLRCRFSRRKIPVHLPSNLPLRSSLPHKAVIIAPTPSRKQGKFREYFVQKKQLTG